MVIKWIQKVGLKSGALSAQLEIPINENIPMVLLQKNKSAKNGNVITNPTKSGKRRIKVTRLLKKRAVFAITLKRMKK